MPKKSRYLPLLFSLFPYLLNMRSILILLVLLQLIYASESYICDEEGYSKYLLTYPSKCGTDCSEYKK